MARPQKKADAEGRTIVWVDESGFYLLPMVVRTYAPRGQTPVLRVPLTRDHLSLISGITPAGHLYVLMQDHAFTSPDIVGFLRHLLAHLPGTLLIVWDGAPIHRGQPVKDFFATADGQRLQLVTLPGYAPELNPDEGIWNYLKRVELRNVCCPSLAHLRRALRLAVMRVRRKPRIIHASIHQAVGYV